MNLCLSIFQYEINICWKGTAKIAKILQQQIFSILQYLGVLHAIGLSLEAMTPGFQNHTAHIFTDCQSALLAVTANKQKRNFCPVLQSISNHVGALSDNNVIVHITWVAGHAGLAGNEKADLLAKQAAQ